MTRLPAPPALPPVGTVTFAATATGVTATLTASALTATSGVASILLVDAATGRPVTLEYGLDSTRATDAAGVLTTVGVPFGTHAVPPAVRAYLMLGTRAVASAQLTLR